MSVWDDLYPFKIKLNGMFGKLGNIAPEQLPIIIYYQHRKRILMHNKLISIIQRDKERNL